MKIALFIVAGLIILGGIVAFSGGSSEEARTTNDTEETMTYQTIKTDVDAGAAFLDVRTPAEYAESHVADAENFSLQLMESGMLPDVGSDTQLYLYCRSGNRSDQAKTILENAGFTNVVDLGGLGDMQALGAPFTN